MDALNDLVAALRRECAEDYVGLWQVQRRLQDLNRGVIAPIADIVMVVAALTRDGSIAIGDFRGEKFVEWPGNVENQLQRLESELRELGHEPDIGEVAWLTER